MKNFYLLLCLFCNYSLAQIIKPEPGLYKPGFVSVTRFDISRPAIKEQPVKDKGRIIQINIWYPSQADTKQMCFKDYVGLAGKELDTSAADFMQQGIDKYFAWPQSLKADKNSFINFLNEAKPMTAFRDAVPLEGKFPLVLLVHGFAADHAYMAEFLAGYGYVVMQVPVKGTAEYDLDYEGKGLETQVLDYEFALAILQNEFSFYTDEKAVAGFSFGGRSAVALALRHKDVNCIISLDGGIGSVFGAALLQKQSYYNTGDIRQPILHFYNPRDQYADLRWFNTIDSSTRFLAAMKHMEHGYFTSFGLLNKIVPRLMGPDAPDPGNGYETVILLTKQFLDASFKNDVILNKDFFYDQQQAFAWIKECIETTLVKEAGT